MTARDPAPTGHTLPVVVDGVPLEARVDLALVDEVLLPALRGLADRAADGRRVYCFLVAPPGAGKSTLAAVVRRRAHVVDPDLDLDVVGLDGFHLPQSHLETHHLETTGGRVPLSAIKGAPETFDVKSLAHRLERARTEDVTWPTYDRRRHDVAPGRSPVTARVVLVEGTWLLLDEPGWADLASHSSLTVFVEADAARLRERLVARKVRGGLSREEAETFYERSDRRNVERVLTGSDRSSVDLFLALGADGTITREATA